MTHAAYNFDEMLQPDWLIRSFVQEHHVAMNGYKNGDYSSGQAAKLCGLSKAQFLEYTSALGIPVVASAPVS